MTVWQTTHVAAHSLIFLGYIAAMVLVPRVLSGLMRISRYTMVAGAGFFIFCGVTHIGLALGVENSPVVSATDHLQAGCILVFIGSVVRDFTAAAARLRAAYVAIGVKYGQESAQEIIATVEAALNDSAPRREDARAGRSPEP